MPEPLSSNAEDVISRSIEVEKDDYLFTDIYEYFEIDRCVDFVKSNNFNKVALQFPDDLLVHVKTICETLEEMLARKVFVLGDTTYGSCCVDEVAAQHISADCIIHFGPACLSRNQTMPVLYVFGKRAIDVSDFTTKVSTMFTSHDIYVLVFIDVVYLHCTDALERKLSGARGNYVISRVSESMMKANISSKVNNSEICTNESHERADELETCKDAPDQQAGTLEASCSGKCQCFIRFGRTFSTTSDLSDYKILYIGKEGTTLMNLMTTFNKNQFYTYDPQTKIARQETLDISRFLMRRYHLIQKCKVANIVGIIVGTLGVSKYNEIIARLKEILTQSGKKYYTLVVGKINVAKLANFMEVDIFVLVACPENTIIDSKEFYKPIATPYEMEIACLKSQEWTGDYVTDFSQLLPGAQYHAQINETDDGECSDPEFSFITGAMINKQGYESTSRSNVCTDLAVRDAETKLTTYKAKDAAEYLSQRTWTGLQLNLSEQTPVETFTEGRAGIASRYTHEPDAHKRSDNIN